MVVGVLKGVSVLQVIQVFAVREDKLGDAPDRVALESGEGSRDCGGVHMYDAYYCGAWDEDRDREWDGDGSIGRQERKDCRRGRRIGRGSW